MEKGGCLPATHSTNDSSTISFHGNSILMVWGQHELTSNHRCVESWLCPFQQVLLSNEKDAIRVSQPPASTALIQRQRLSVTSVNCFHQDFFFPNHRIFVWKMYYLQKRKKKLYVAAWADSLTMQLSCMSGLPRQNMVETGCQSLSNM